MSHIDNPNGRIKFKDIRKITIGVSKKDIMSYRSKKKQAFYNCFVMILRIKIDELFREFHIKVFNTGKLEIPGVQSEAMFIMVLNNVINILNNISSLVDDLILTYITDDQQNENLIQVQTLLKELEDMYHSK
jgi:hypothetical protein